MTKIARTIFNAVRARKGALCKDGHQFGKNAINFGFAGLYGGIIADQMEVCLFAGTAIFAGLIMLIACADVDR